MSESGFVIAGGYPSARLVLHGEIDVAASADLYAAAAALPDQDVTIDLAGVDFIDATALGVLVGVSNRQRDMSRQLFLLSPRAAVRRVFVLAGLISLLQVAR